MNRSWTPTIMAILSVVIVGAAFLVVPPLLFPPEATPTPMARPDDSASGSPAPSANVSFPPSPFRSVSWQIVDFEPGATIADVAIIGDRLIALGQADGLPAAWLSVDGGLGWTRAELVAPEPPAEGAQLGLRAIATTPERAVATAFWVLPDGTGDFPPLLFVSDDAGQTWAPSQVDDALVGPFDVVAAGDTGFLGVGFDRLAGFTLWYSASGDSWVRLETRGLDGQAQTFAVRDGEGVAVGFGADGRDVTPVFWSSRDLLTWETVTVDETNPGMTATVIAFTEGYAAGGYRWLPEQRQQNSWAALWLSNDGRSWLEVPLTESGGWQVSGLAAGEAGVFASLASTVRSDGRLAFLPSGASAVSSVVMPFRVDALVAVSDGFVAVGWCYSDPCPGSFVGIGTLSEDTDVPDPTLPPHPSASPGG
jgi:hypothetical protein